MSVFKTALLLTVLTMLLIFGGQALAGQQGMTIALVMAFVMNIGAYFFSDKIALKSSGARAVTREQAPRLDASVERLAARGNLPMPKVYIIPQPAPNAFATGRNPSHAAVAATEGLLQVMNDDELDGVIAHELGHVKNYDILTASVAATIAGAITWLAYMAQWALIFGGGRSRDNRGGGGGMAALAMIILAPLAATIVQLAISRQREYAADASAARLVGHPYGLASALEKLGSYNKRIPMNVPPANASLFIVAPLSAGQMFSSLFSTHPPLEKRIAALRNMVISH
jgi:heat shock protein HtpX